MITNMLENLVGQNVIVRNIAFDEMDEGRMTINFEGKLERNDDHGYYLRVCETYIGGACGVGFTVRQVKEVRKLTFSTAIILH